MSRLLKKLFFIFLPIGVYLGIFVYFEPYNYFGIKTKNYDPDSAIVRVRNYMQDPAVWLTLIWARSETLLASLWDS